MPLVVRYTKSTYKRKVPWRKQFKRARSNRPIDVEADSQPIYLYQMTLLGYAVYLARIGSIYRYRNVSLGGMLFEMDMPRILNVTQVEGMIRIAEELARETS